MVYIFNRPCDTLFINASRVTDSNIVMRDVIYVIGYINVPCIRVKKLPKTKIMIYLNVVE